jgi:L-lactate dehydrogenase complex protein LldG
MDAVPRSQGAGRPNVRGAVSGAGVSDATRTGAAVVSGARAAILARIDRALRTAYIPATAAVDVGRAADGGASDADLGVLQSRFAVEARAVGADVFVESSAPRVCERVADLIAGRRVLSWNAERLPYGVGALVAGATFGLAPRHEQAAAQVGVTACHGAIAETGTLALLSEPGCSRAVSLLPPVHIAIVEPRRLFATTGDFFDACASEIAGASNLTFVTGPSRTADIELTLTIGVHGPARVAIVIGPPN